MTAEFFEPFAPRANHNMEPNLSLGQFNFTNETASDITNILDSYNNPCCLCTPTIATEWEKRGRKVTLLDIDSRYSEIGNYLKYDILAPVSIEKCFDVIVVDPPFFPPRIIYNTITTLVGDSKPDLFLVFDAMQEVELLEQFKDWKLQPVDFSVEHHHVKPNHQERFRLYGTKPSVFENYTS